MLITKALIFYLVAGQIHFTLFGIILPTIKLKVYTFLGLVNSATKSRFPSSSRCPAYVEFKGTLRKLVRNLALQEEGEDMQKGNEALRFPWLNS